MEEAEKLLSHFESLDTDGIFARPVSESVDKRVYKAYLEIVTTPMDFSTMRIKLKNSEYENPCDFYSDLKLIFENACKFNSPENNIYLKAQEFLEIFKNHGADEIIKNATLFYSIPKKQIYKRKHEGISNVYLPYSYLRPNRAPSTIDASGPVTLYQFDPDPTLELVEVAEKVGFPFENLILPCFGLLTNQSALNNPIPKKTKLEFNEFQNYVPTNPTDLKLFYFVYKKNIGELIEKSLQNGIAKLTPAQMDEEDLFDMDSLPTEGQFMNITNFLMPPEEFMLLFRDFATNEQISRFNETKENTGNPTMWIKIPSFSEAKRMFGIFSVRVPIVGSENDFCLIHSPMVLSLKGSMVTIKGVVRIVDLIDLPKDFGKVSNKGKSRDYDD